MTERPVILITGSRKGIGRFLVDHFLGKGWYVEGCSREKQESPATDFRHHVADVVNEEQVKRMLASIQKRHGRLDAVVNNAGVAAMNHALLMPLGTATQIMTTNFIGTFLVCRESAKLMKRRNFGRIVNISSVAVPLRLEGEAVYAASKSAIETFTRILAKELAGFGITCNVVGPAPVETDLIRNVPRDKIDRIIGQLAGKRMGQPGDVAEIIDLLIRPESSAITGQVLYLGGA